MGAENVRFIPNAIGLWVGGYVASWLIGAPTAFAYGTLFGATWVAFLVWSEDRTKL